VRVASWSTEEAVEPPAELPVAEAPRGLQRLTARQLQVVALLADGLRYREIAACLAISVRQVERHVAHAIARLGVKSVYELVAVAVREGLVPAGDRPREP
jgi:DNA-binding CsgD family transcriptional regulator